MVDSQLEKFTLNRQFLAALIPCIAISILTVFNITGTVRIAALLVCLLPYIVVDENHQLLTLLFFVGFAADINIFFAGIPYITVLQLFFVLKSFVNTRIANKTVVLYLILIVLTQVYAVLCCNQSLINLVTFILNFLIMLVIGSNIIVEREMYLKYCAIFVAGILVVLVASIVRDPAFFSGTYYRFKGIWTDQNFLAMFCALAFVLLYYWTERKVKNMIIAAPACLGLIYCAYRTYSMTFIFAAVMIVVVLMLDLFQAKVHLVYKAIGIIGIIILAYFFYENIYLGIVEGRGREVYVAGTDWTHGRTRDTFIVLDAWAENLGNLFFGIGVSNSGSYTGFAAHNTYVEILAQFGIVGTLITLAGIIFFLFRYQVSIKMILDIKAGYVFILLLYMGTLSMQSTDVVFLLLGLMVNLILNPENGGSVWAEA